MNVQQKFRLRLCNAKLSIGFKLLVLVALVVCYIGIVLFTTMWDTIFYVDAVSKELPQQRRADTVCPVSMYRHSGISSVFTRLMPPSLSVLDEQKCKPESAPSENPKWSKGELLRCHPDKAWSTSEMSNASLADVITKWTARHRRTKWYEKRSWLNVYHGGHSPANLLLQGNAVLAALGLTKLVMRIESDIASCRQWHKEEVQATCNRADPVAFNATEQDNVVVVELGSANANLLHSFCPPDPLRRLRCYGVELIPALVDDAVSYQGHMNVESGIQSSLRDSSATHVLIHGVLPILPIQDGCDSIREGLRLLVPGGMMLIVMLHTGLQAAWSTRHHPFFFNNTYAKSNSSSPSSYSILPYCSLHSQTNFDQLVDSVEFLWNAAEFLLYIPNYTQTGIYAVRLTRSSVKMEQKAGEAIKEESPRSFESGTYKRLCSNPEDLTPIKKAQVKWAQVVVDMKEHFVRKKIKKGVYIWVSRKKH